MSTFVALTDGFQIFRYPGCGENDDENSSKRRDGSFSLLRCCLVMESPQNSVRYKPASQSKLSASSYIQRFFQATLSRLRSFGAMRLLPSCEQKVTCRKLEPHISSSLIPKHSWVWFFVPKHCGEGRCLLFLLLLCLKKLYIFMSVPNTCAFCSSDNHRHQLAHWLGPAFFGLDLRIHRDVPHRFHIVIGPTNSVEAWVTANAQTLMQLFLGWTWWTLHFATKSCWQ